jgi:hypothetical protein
MGTPEGEHSTAVGELQRYSLGAESAGGDRMDGPHHPAVEGQEAASNGGGKIKKSGSGFFRGLRRNKSSGSLADGDGASAAASDVGSVHAGPDSIASDDVAPKKKGMKKLLSLGRSKKAKGSSSSLAQDAADAEAAEIEA